MFLLKMPCPTISHGMKHRSAEAGWMATCAHPLQRTPCRPICAARPLPPTRRRSRRGQLHCKYVYKLVVSLYLFVVVSFHPRKITCIWSNPERDALLEKVSQVSALEGSSFRKQLTHTQLLPTMPLWDLMIRNSQRELPMVPPKGTCL